MMPEISAVIITLNEEKNIARCLDSLTGVADEIIVVDSCSTDRTAEICEKFGVRVIRKNFEGYVEQKNFAVSQAKYPLILSLDADEALSPALRESILEVKRDCKHDGYYFNRINNYCGTWIRYTSWYPDRKLRLWYREKGKWVGRYVHEKVELKKGSSTKLLKGDIEHFSFYSVSEHIRQVDNFTTLAARSYYDEGISSGYMKIIFRPLWKFFRELVLKRGFMQGYYGWVISSIISFQTFLKYVKLKQLYRNPENN